MVYEKMKSWGFERKRKQYAGAGKVYGAEADKLVRCTFGPVQKQNSEY
jgi:solute carrier family 25 folate transporter 32